jgi:hypothetical protein
MGNVMTVDEAMTVVKENGYSFILKDHDFHIDPPDGLEKIAEVVHSLKDEMLSALELTGRVTNWANNDSKKWGMLLKLVKNDRELTNLPWATLVDWTSNRMSYSRGLQYANTPDISFFSRVVERIERRVPEALVREKKIAWKLRKKVM